MLWYGQEEAYDNYRKLEQVLDSMPVPYFDQNKLHRIHFHNFDSDAKVNIIKAIHVPEPLGPIYSPRVRSVVHELILVLSPKVECGRTIQNS